MNKFIASISALLLPLAAFAWGQKGHDTTAAIAERHITPTTAAAIDSLLDGSSIIYWSNWADNACHTPEYEYTAPWHYINIDPGYTIDTMPQAEGGNIITGLRQCMATLTSPEADKSDKATALKFLVHFVGDMHQPLHCGRLGDRGGNDIQVIFFRNNMKLHAVWDSSLPEAAHKWSYTEWADQIDRADAARHAQIISGDLEDWVTETVAVADAVYAESPVGKKLSYDEVARWSPVVEEQFLRGGLRLAHILNTIFDPAYTPTAIGSK